MHQPIVFSLIAALAACPLRGQASSIIPSYARDSLEAADRRSPEALRARQRNLDSLAAGLRRWKAANVAEYQLQVHSSCFCIFEDTTWRSSVVTVRGGLIVAHAPGLPSHQHFVSTTIDTLFAVIERDVRDAGRVVRRLQLDARYGFPRDYRAETPTIPDLWLEIQVDSFAVTHAGSASPRRPPAP